MIAVAVAVAAAVVVELDPDGLQQQNLLCLQIRLWLSLYRGMLKLIGYIHFLAGSIILIYVLELAFAKISLATILNLAHCKMIK